MRKMNVKIVIAVFAAIMFTGAFAMAQPGPRHGEGRYDDWKNRSQERINNNSPRHAYLSEQLSLTDDQKTKIEEIRLASAKESLQRRNKINELEAQLTTALTQEKVDKAGVNKLIEEIGKLNTENRKGRMADHLAIRELLTDSQKILFDQHQPNKNRPGAGRHFSR